MFLNTFISQNILTQNVKNCQERFTFSWMSGLQNPFIQNDFNMFLDKRMSVKVYPGLELPDNQYGFKERDVSWDYSDANIPYEGSYFTTTDETGRNVVASGRGKPKGGVDKDLRLALHKPHMVIKAQ